MERIESARTARLVEAHAGNLRERMILAAMASGGALPANVQVQLAAALSHASVVDTAVRTFETLAANEAALDDVLRARLVECADLVVAHGWHGRAGKAASLAGAMRAKLREAEALAN